MKEDWVGTGVMVFSCWLCAACFLGFGLFARRTKKPMWFWSGSKVDPGSITDVPAYNRANSWMWIAYSLPFWACGVLSFWRTVLAGILLSAACLAGTPVLVLVYTWIFNKYKRNDYE